MAPLVVHGVAMPLRSNDVSPRIWQALVNGSYEAREARGICRAVRRHDRVLELGSGLGVITTLIGKVPNVKVWAFEANPSTFALAKKVIEGNNLDNVVLCQGILSAGEPQHLTFYIRRDMWMSSIVESQGPYKDVVGIRSSNIDVFIRDNAINVIVMDIEGAERDLLSRAALPGIERIFLELHDHLYGLSGIRDITSALASKGFAYDPRGSCGACVLFAKDDGPRKYQPEAE